MATAIPSSDRFAARMLRGEVGEGPYDLDQLCEALAIRDGELGADPKRIEAIQRIFDRLKGVGLIRYIDTGRKRALPVALPWLMRTIRVGGGQETMEQEARRKRQESRQREFEAKYASSGPRLETIWALSEQDLLKAKPDLAKDGYWPSAADICLCVYAAGVTRRELKEALLGPNEEKQIIEPGGKVGNFDTLTERKKELRAAALLDNGGGGKGGLWSAARTEEWFRANGYRFIDRNHRITAPSEPSTPTLAVVPDRRAHRCL